MIIEKGASFLYSSKWSIHNLQSYIRNFIDYSHEINKFATQYITLLSIYRKEKSAINKEKMYHVD